LKFNELKNNYNKKFGKGIFPAKSKWDDGKFGGRENNEKLKLSTKFIVEYLIKGLEENINYPSVDILISSWLLYFETVPQINLNKYYIQIIPSLFKMLCGNIKEVIHISEFCLRKIINSIDTLYEDLINEDPKLITKIFEIVLENCVSKEGNE
jgi:hypothetical protein